MFCNIGLNVITLTYGLIERQQYPVGGGVVTSS